MKDDLVYKSLLMDFYGELLTENQKNIMDMYYNHDFSLGEISEITKISRQGVYDALKRAENALQGYEEKLKLIDRFIKQDSLLKKANSEIEQILNHESTDEGMKKRLLAIKNILKDLI